MRRVDMSDSLTAVELLPGCTTQTWHPMKYLPCAKGCHLSSTQRCAPAHNACFSADSSTSKATDLRPLHTWDCKSLARLCAYARVQTVEALKAQDCLRNGGWLARPAPCWCVNTRDGYVFFSVLRDQRHAGGGFARWLLWVFFGQIAKAGSL